MLLRFAVANHRSFRDRQELSLVASSLNDDPGSLLATRHAPNGQVLPVVVIYGPNASGKSNLIDAFAWMRGAVLHSHNQGDPRGGVKRSPFALDKSLGSTPSRFEVDFVTAGVRYHYGFEASDEAFTAEWLYAFPNERRQELFDRTGNRFSFGRNLKGRNQIISELTRPNSLFLAAAAQNGHDELTAISAFFRTLAIGELNQALLVADITERSLDFRVIDILKAAGTGVTAYRLADVDFSPKNKEFLEGMLSLVSRIHNITTEPVIVPDDAKSLQLGHTGSDGQPVYFNLDQESDGTKRLLALLIPAFRALDEGTVMVVDELDASLHTQACELVVALFSSPVTNTKGAQLVTTTHDTNLLQSAHLRRDQVWLTEKGPAGSTKLYPLTDFRTRKGDNLEKGYLQGRYGAVPFAGRAVDVLASH